MNKIIVGISIVIAIFLFQMGWSFKSKVDDLRDQYSQMEQNNQALKDELKRKQYLPKEDPVLLSVAYGRVLNRARVLESNSGTAMTVKLKDTLESEDISSQYENTEYTGIRGLKLEIIVDKFSKETDMGAVLDDIHTLEKQTDFIASEITKDNNNVIVKGEVYGL